MNTITAKPATSDTFKAILNKMDYYKRAFGYMAYDNSGELTFFDSEPSFGGAYVTRDEVVSYFNDAVKQDNTYTTAINCLYYGDCDSMMKLAAGLSDDRLNNLKMECARLDRFVSSINSLS